MRTPACPECSCCLNKTRRTLAVVSGFVGFEYQEQSKVHHLGDAGAFAIRIGLWMYLQYI